MKPRKSPAQSKHEAQSLLELSVDEFFKKDVMYKNIPAEAEEYWASDYQRKKYEELKSKDKIYENHIIKKYGSYANFEKQSGIGVAENIFDPLHDFHLDVTIITKNKFYKTDHISPYELIRETLYGVCTTDFIKKDGQIGRIVGTLDKKFILPFKVEERENFFSPMAGNRIGMWNIIKQDWSSFYISKAIRFVRDDTTDLE